MTQGYMHEYLENIKRRSEESVAQRAAIHAERLKPLPVKIQEWWEALPESERSRPFTMDELVQQLGMPPGRIGPALHSLGWERKRKWGKGSYVRYWVADIE